MVIQIFCSFLRRLLDFKGNMLFVNVARTPLSSLTIATVKDSRLGSCRRFVALARSQRPAMFLSLVHVVSCNLLQTSPVVLEGSDFRKRTLFTKALVANFFRQELELVVCNLGCLFDIETVVLPAWGNGGDDQGISFQTALITG